MLQIIKTKPRGFSVVETMLAVSVLGLIVTAVMGAFLYVQKSSVLSGNRNRALLLAEEGLEASRNIRDSGFENLIAGTHGLSYEGGQWVLSGSSDSLGAYTRQLEVIDVDSDRKQVTSTVTWNQSQQRTGVVSLVTYLNYWMKEQVADLGDWENPFEASFLDFSGNSNGWKAQIQGDYLYLIRTGGKPDFMVVNVSNSASPTIVDTLNLSGGPRDIVISGNYAYVASASNRQELQVLDISSPSNVSQIASYDAPGNADGRGLSVVGNTLYMVRLNSDSDELVSFDVSDPENIDLLDSLDLQVSAYDLLALGNHLYIASSGNNQEVIVINATDPPNLKKEMDYNLPGNSNAWSINGFGSTVLVGRSNGNVVIMDVSDPNELRILSTYTDSDDSIRDIALGNGNQYIFLATDSDFAEFQGVDISDLSQPSYLGGLDLEKDLNGIAYSSDLDRAFGVGDDNDAELIIFSPS